MNKQKKYDWFWKIVEKNRKEVATWPLWKRRIVINAKTASTGQFIDRSIK